MDELNRLENIAQHSIYGQGLSGVTVRYSGQLFLRYMNEGSVLELGPAEGIMTEILYPKYRNDYTVVDGSNLFINQLKLRYPDIKAFTSLFEDFVPKKKYSNIILGHVLEHVIDPVEIIKLCRDWLDDNGVILAAVPNANSIHRQAAVEMGLLKKLDDFSEKDRRHGHRRVFFRNEFIDCFTQAGCRILEHGGYWLKPLSDSQIEKDWTEDMVNAFFKLGENYPDIAGEIYVIAK